MDEVILWQKCNKNCNTKIDTKNWPNLKSDKVHFFFAVSGLKVKVKIAIVSLS